MKQLEVIKQLPRKPRVLVVFTDGIVWNSARHNLEETFDVLYNLKDLETGAIDTLVDSKKYLESLMNTK